MPALLSAAENGCSDGRRAGHDRAASLFAAHIYSSPSISTSGAVALKFLIDAVGLWFPTLRLNFFVKILSGVFGCSR